MKELSTAQLDRWCKTATEQILFGPDRRRVAEELRNHLEDHRMSLIEQGMDQQEANLQALEAMGSAEELAPQLAAIHKPFWGRTIRISKVLLVILLIFGICPIVNYFCFCGLYFTTLDLEEIYPDYYVEEREISVQHLSVPRDSFTSGGITFVVTDAMILTDQFGDQELHVLIDRISLLPALEHAEYRSSSLFHVADSTGTQYVNCDSLWDLLVQDQPCVLLYAQRQGLFSSTMRYRIFDFNPDNVEWVNLSYNRDGRSYNLLVDLTGGGTK